MRIPKLFCIVKLRLNDTAVYEHMRGENMLEPRKPRDYKDHFCCICCRFAYSMVSSIFTSR